MKRTLLALAALTLLASSALAQSYGYGEKLIPFRSTGATGTYNYNSLGSGGTILFSYQDSSYTSRGGAAWGSTVNSQTDTTVWFSYRDFPDFTINPYLRAGTVPADSFFVFRMAFVPAPDNAANGLTPAADSIYVTLQGTNDGGQNVTSASAYTQLVNPTSANGFTRAFYSQTNGSNPSAIGLTTFLGFKQWRFIISSDINGRYAMTCEYPKLVK